MSEILIQLSEFGSQDQIQSIALRYEILRKPLGLFFETNELKNEHNQQHIVAKIGNLVVGCLLLVPNENGTVKMRQVAVLEQYQGKGIGLKLVQFSEEISQKNNFNKIELHARLSAVPFYTKLNYSFVGEEFVEVNIPHMKMVKIL